LKDNEYIFSFCTFLHTTNRAVNLRRKNIAHTRWRTWKSISFHSSV